MTYPEHPSNVLKYCPFCGAAGFEWDGVKAHTCRACNHKLYTNTAAAVVGIIENECGEILFVRRKYNPAAGMLDLPGGFVELDETAEDAIVREIKEELCLEVASLQFLRTFSNRYPYGGLLYFTTDLVYRCTVSDFSAMCAKDDAAECLFLSKKQIDISQIGLMSIKNVVKMYCS
jgi:mutator protein MutT